jgi:hypothetical protein
VRGHLNALHNPFVYDDHDTILGNRSLEDLSNRFILIYTPFRPLVNACMRSIGGCGAQPLGLIT